MLSEFEELVMAGRGLLTLRGANILRLHLSRRTLTADERHVLNRCMELIDMVGVGANCGYAPRDNDLLPDADSATLAVYAFDHWGLTGGTPSSPQEFNNRVNVHYGALATLDSDEKVRDAESFLRGYSGVIHGVLRGLDLAKHGSL